MDCEGNAVEMEFVKLGSVSVEISSQIKKEQRTRNHRVSHPPPCQKFRPMHPPHQNP